MSYETNPIWDEILKGVKQNNQDLTELRVYVETEFTEVKQRQLALENPVANLEQDYDQLKKGQERLEKYAVAAESRLEKIEEITELMNYKLEDYGSDLMTTRERKRASSENALNALKATQPRRQRHCPKLAAARSK